MNRKQYATELYKKITRSGRRWKITINKFSEIEILGNGFIRVRSYGEWAERDTLNGFLSAFKSICNKWNGERYVSQNFKSLKITTESW